MADNFTRQSLLRRLKDPSDESSWDDFRRTYAPYVTMLLRRMRLGPEDCEDLLQELMLICWRQLPQMNYDPEKGRFRGWLAVVTRNEALRWLKKQQRLAAGGNDEIERLGCDDVAFEQLADEEWRRFISQRAWDNIAPHFSPAVLQLFQAVAAGEDPESAAARFGLARASVYVYKKRVLNSLQKEILRLQKELL
ncbi:MAG: hypothetical protein RL095_3409 [Verrucomicrobiota bacterium]|jgi:RNA polymerase sigma factor (sigma-70 family)